MGTGSGLSAALVSPRANVPLRAAERAVAMNPLVLCSIVVDVVRNGGRRPSTQPSIDLLSMSSTLTATPSPF
jgi:hypothetical protein